MERDVSCGAIYGGAEPGSSGGPSDEKVKDIDSSHRVNEAEDEEYPEADTLGHSSASTSSEGDNYNDESTVMGEEQSDSRESEGKTSVPWTSPRGPKESGRKRKYSNNMSYSDLSYLNSLSRRKRRRIEGEIIKGCKLGECIKISHMTIDHVL
jgi:hypothetical protein